MENTKITLVKLQKIIIVLGIIIAISFLGYFLFIKIFGAFHFEINNGISFSPPVVSSKLVYLPSTLPPGFHSSGNTYLMMMGPDENISQQYKTDSGNHFSFSSISNQAFFCHPPTQVVTSAPNNLNVILNYHTIMLSDGTTSCVYTINNGRVYQWAKGDLEFTIIADNLSITDDQFIIIANSVRPQTVQVTENQTVPISR